MTPAEVLRKAAGILRERGWDQGTYENAAGACCLMGSIYLVSAASDESRACAIAAVQQVLGSTSRSPTAWNDHPDRTADEVIGALLRAADLAEGGTP